jgi:hypothetical protein
MAGDALVGVGCEAEARWDAEAATHQLGEVQRLATDVRELARADVRERHHQGGPGIVVSGGPGVVC